MFFTLICLRKTRLNWVHFQNYIKDNVWIFGAKEWNEISIWKLTVVFFLNHSYSFERPRILKWLQNILYQVHAKYIIKLYWLVKKHTSFNPSNDCHLIMKVDLLLNSSIFLTNFLATCILFIISFLLIVN